MGSAHDGEPLETGGLDRILEHNVGDFTAVLEAGVPFAEAQAPFAEHGQPLAWDPPRSRRGDDRRDRRDRRTPARCATATAACATSSSGTTVVLSDGTIAKSGGKVIKNVAGYDLAKLFAGSFGTLGLIATVSVRLHPLPEQHRDRRRASDDPDALLARRRGLTRLPLEADCFDVAWERRLGPRPRALQRHPGGRAGARAGARMLARRRVHRGRRCAVDAQRARQRAPTARC